MPQVAFSKSTSSQVAWISSLLSSFVRQLSRWHHVGSGRAAGYHRHRLAALHGRTSRPSAAVPPPSQRTGRRRSLRLVPKGRVEHGVNSRLGTARAAKALRSATAWHRGVLRAGDNVLPENYRYGRPILANSAQPPKK